ncbi:carbohydrate ABC transporter permease, partial [Catellatospora chokoriensis]
MKNLMYRLDVKGSPYLYIVPFFLLFAAFGIFPLAYTAWVSLHEWSLLSETHTFLGLQNYQELFADEYFWNALRNTAQIWVLSTVPQLLMALVLAHVLNQRLRAPTFWRMTAVL